LVVVEDELDLFAMHCFGGCSLFVKLQGLLFGLAEKGTASGKRQDHIDVECLRLCDVRTHRYGHG